MSDDDEPSRLCCFVILVVLLGLLGLYWYNYKYKNDIDIRAIIIRQCMRRDCELSDWSLWSRCENPCEGKTYRTRYVRTGAECDGTPCSHYRTQESQPCDRLCQYDGTMHIMYDHPQDQCSCPSGYNGPCCKCKVQDCMMSEWSDWSSCSRRCGPFGTKARSRSIEKRPKCGGSDCPLPVSLSEELPCNRFCHNGGSLDSLDRRRPSCNCPDGFTGECCECKVQDCIMTEWGDWSDCKIVRGARGEQSRTRTIDTPPKCNGTACSTKRLRKRYCNICGNNGALEPSQNWCRCRHGFSGKFCDCKDIDCELSQWSWSPCENAVRTKSRYVIRNSTCAGKKCNGLLTEGHPCEGFNQSSSYVLYLGAFLLVACLLVLLTIRLYGIGATRYFIYLITPGRIRRLYINDQVIESDGHIIKIHYA